MLDYNNIPLPKRLDTECFCTWYWDQHVSIHMLMGHETIFPQSFDFWLLMGTLAQISADNPLVFGSCIGEYNQILSEHDGIHNHHCQHALSLRREHIEILSSCASTWKI